MERSISMRLKWVRLYEKTGNAGLVCRRCGISRPTLRKWHQRFVESGIEGLCDHSKKPHNSPNQKMNADIEALILDIRKKRKLGARRIQNELKRLHRKAPIDIVCKIKDKTPYYDEVGSNYDPSKERIQEQNYIQDLKIRQLK